MTCTQTWVASVIYLTNAFGLHNGICIYVGVIFKSIFHDTQVYILGRFILSKHFYNLLISFN